MNQKPRSNGIWQNVLRYLHNNGFPGPICSRIRVTLYASGRIGAERRYRFRWQKLYANRADRGVLDNDFVWEPMLGYAEARLPDSGQLNDAIGIANRREVMRIEDRKKLYTFTLDGAGDADDVKKKVDSKIDNHVIEKPG